MSCGSSLGSIPWTSSGSLLQAPEHLLIISGMYHIHFQFRAILIQRLPVLESFAVHVTHEHTLLTLVQVH